MSLDIELNVYWRWLLNEDVFTQPLRYVEDVTEGQFLSSVKLIWIQHFLLLDWLPNQLRSVFQRLNSEFSFS